MIGAFPWDRNRTQAELQVLIGRQLGHLRRSADAYDADIYEEAERLANSVYLFVHSTWKSTALLEQADLLRTLKFLDTRSNRCPGLPLAQIRVEGDFGWYDARYDWNDGNYPEVSFAQWWEQDIHLRKGLVSRRHLTRTMRNKDGGGHIDPKLEEHYERFHAEPIRAFQIKDGAAVIVFEHNHGKGTREPPPAPLIPNAHWASMRQIAWELTETLRRGGYCSAMTNETEGR